MKAPSTTSRSAARRLHGAAAVIALAVLGCSPSYVYLPTEQVTAVVEGQPAARYAIPPEAPTGDVRIHSFGLVDLEAAGGGDEAAVHARLWISNDGASRPWTLDTRKVRVELRGGPEGRPTVLTAGGESLPVVEIPPGEQRVVDMFFPLPAGYDHADSLPAFDVMWQVQTGTRAHAERTPFERIRVEAPPPAGPTWGFAYGTGFGWWYDPWWRPGAGYGMGRSVVLQNRETILQPRVYVRPMIPARPAPR